VSGVHRAAPDGPLRHGPQRWIARPPIKAKSNRSVVRKLCNSKALSHRLREIMSLAFDLPSWIQELASASSTHASGLSHWNRSTRSVKCWHRASRLPLQAASRGVSRPEVLPEPVPPSSMRPQIVVEESCDLQGGVRCYLETWVIDFI
jgi:hypothetical protein